MDKLWEVLTSMRMAQISNCRTRRNMLARVEAIIERLKTQGPW
jgi:hypothetical protein